MHFACADVGEYAACEAAWREIDATLGPVDTLVNNAGISPKHAGKPMPVWQMDPAAWQRVIDVRLAVPSQTQTKHLPTSKRPAVTHHVIGRACQFVRQSLHRHDCQSLRLLALIKLSRLRAAAQRGRRGLDEGPGKIPVAVLRVAFAFLLAVGDPLALDTPAIGTDDPRRILRALRSTDTSRSPSRRATLS